MSETPINPAMRGNPYAVVSHASPHDGAAIGGALMALAFEQRTASLIAWTTENGSVPTADTLELIGDRLGFGKDTDDEA